MYLHLDVTLNCDL